MSQIKQDKKIIREFLSLIRDTKRFRAAKEALGAEKEEELQANESMKKSLTININM
jgi:hypothetical protein